MYGRLNADAAQASRRKHAYPPDVSSPCLYITLIATGRSRARSSPLYTSPIPPEPSFSRILYFVRSPIVFISIHDKRMPATRVSESFAAPPARPSACRLKGDLIEMVAVDLHRGSHRTSSRSPLRGAGFSRACELASNTRTIDATFSAKVNGVLCQLRISAALVSERFV